MFLLTNKHLFLSLFLPQAAFFFLFASFCESLPLHKCFAILLCILLTCLVLEKKTNSLSGIKLLEIKLSQLESPKLFLYKTYSETGYRFMEFV